MCPDLMVVNSLALRWRLLGNPRRGSLVQDLGGHDALTRFECRRSGETYDLACDSQTRAGGTSQSGIRMEDLEGRTVRGGLAKLCAQATNLVLRVTFLAALARLLSPEDFGLVGMVTVATGLINIVTHAWLSSGSVQQATIDERQLSTLFCVYASFGVFLCGLCFAAAPVLASFYDEPRLFAVTGVLGIGCLFTTAGVQHYAILQRQLRYVALAVIEAVSLFVSIVVGIAMALAGYGYWALVGATVVLPVCNTISLWLATRWVPGLPCRDADIRSTLRFGGLIIFNILIVYIAYNLDKVLIGWFWGAEALGIYGRAYQLATIPSDNINAAIGGVAFSALSRLQDDPVRFKTLFLNGYALVVSMARTPLRRAGRYWIGDDARGVTRFWPVRSRRNLDLRITARVPLERYRLRPAVLLPNRRLEPLGILGVD
jgi:hypothetical protein